MIILIWILFGGLVGWIASILTHNNARMGLFANIIVGLIGCSLGGWLASLMGLGSISTFSLGGMLIAVMGAVVLLAVLNLIRGKR